jgi:hypothetical protein
VRKPGAITADDLSVITDRDSLVLDCPVCHVYIGVEHGLTLSELRAKAAEHVAEVHVPVADGALGGIQP